MGFTRSVGLSFGAYEPRYQPQQTEGHTHVVRLTWRNGEQVLIPRKTGLDLIGGVPISSARIAVNGISAITENAGVQSNVATITGCTLKLVDVDYDMANRFGNNLVAGAGSRHSRVEIFAFDPDEPMDEKHLIYTFILDGYQNTKEGKTKILNLVDVSRESTKTIFETKEWTLTQSVGTGQKLIDIASTADDDFRFARGPNDNRYPNNFVGYMRFGDDGEIWSYNQRIRVSDDVYTYVVLDRGLFGTTEETFIKVESTSPIENNQKVKEFVYYQEDVRDALLMATVGRTFDGRVAPAHWSPEIDIDYVDPFSIGSDAAGESTVEVEEPDEQEAKTFYETYLLPRANNSVFRISNKGKLTLKPVPHAAPEADASVVFDATNIDLSTLSPLKVNQSDLADTITAKWDYDPLTKDYANITVERDLISTAVHGASSSYTLELPTVHTGTYTTPQVRSAIVSASERLSNPTTTISFDAITSMRWVSTGTLVRLTLDGGVIIDDSTGAALNLDRTFLVIGRRYNPSTRKIRYFLWGTSGQAIQRENSRLTSHIPDTEFKRGAINLADVLPITGGVLSGVHSLAPGKYYYEGNLRLSPTFSCTFTSRGPKFQLCVLGVFIIQSANPFELRGMGIHRGGNGASSAGPATTGEPGYFGRPVSAGGFVNTQRFDRKPLGDAQIYAKGDFTYSPTQGVTNPPATVETIPSYELSLNNNQFSGIPADLSSSGSPGGAGVDYHDPDLDGFAARTSSDHSGRGGVPVPTTTHVADGADGEWGTMGLEFWSRGGGWDGAGGINISGKDNASVPADDYGLVGGAPGRTPPGAFVWIMDDPAAPLPDMGPDRVKAFTGEVIQPGVRSNATDTRWPLELAFALVPDLLHSYHEVPARRNLALSAARAMYSPVPAVTERRTNPSYQTVSSLRQERGQIELIISTSTSIPPSPPPSSEGLPGDLGITQIELDGTNAQPPAWIKDDNNIWQPVVWAGTASDYKNLILLYRAEGTTKSILSATRPVNEAEGTHWIDEATGIEWILGETAAEDRMFRYQGAAVGRNLTNETKFAKSKQGYKIWGATRNGFLEPFNALDKAAEDLSDLFIATGVLEGEYIASGTTTSDETVQPPVIVTISGTSDSITVTFAQPSDQDNIASAEILLDGEVIATPTTSPYVITGRTPSTTYSIVVRNIGTSGNRSSSYARIFTTASESGSGQLGITLISSGADRIVSGTAHQDNVSVVIEQGRQGTLSLSDGYVVVITVQSEGSFSAQVPASKDDQLGLSASLYFNNGDDSTKAQLSFTYEL